MLNSLKKGWVESIAVKDDGELVHITDFIEGKG
ncbi:hypothetical protein PMIT1313_00837 [Prochlorococcus marinus str. MIT 1313]|nr:hypothetical protein PMIT1313_00837 [Prochlorococcus marinus str. MIT 1313]KZR72909.1 hypothetical protein PMIT1318_00877 [Prochlorococcus marinus str. MIT 1318]